jgi:hypothetical protein
VKIDNLDTVAPRIPKVAAEGRLQLEFVFPGKLLSDFLQLLLVAHHDPEMPNVGGLHFLNFKNGQELVLTEFKERVPLTTAHLFQIKNILVKRHRLLDVIHLNRDMIASINLHAHTSV